MIAEKQLLSAVIVYNKLQLIPKVNPIWFKDNVNLEIWKNSIFCFNEYKKIDSEVLKTWLYNQENKLTKVMIERIKGLDEVYPADNVVENLQSYFIDNCLKEYINFHMKKDITVDAKKQKYNEIYKKINTGIDIDESKSFEENINEYIQNVYEEKIDNRFNNNSIEIEDKNLKKLFGKYIRPWPIVIGGNPGYCKTTLMLNILKEIDRHKMHGLIFSFEDTIDTLRNKYIGIKTGISTDNIINNKYDNDKKNKLKTVHNKKKRTWIIEKPCDVLRFRQIVDKHIVTYDIKYIMIDYFQLFYGLKGLSKVEGLELVAKELVNIRKDYEIPIICLSQLSTEEGREADLTDLKWCKALGENARQVFMIYEGTEEDNKIIKCVKNTFYGNFKKILLFDNRSGRLENVYETN